MKEYGICLLLVIVTSIVYFFAGYWVTKQNIWVEPVIPSTTHETEIATENRQVMNQEKVEPVIETERCYLMSETGFLLVFCENESAICLYAHAPITDLPEKEQDRLKERIWFTSVMDIYNYLESYTSQPPEEGLPGHEAIKCHAAWTGEDI